VRVVRFGLVGIVNTVVDLVLYVVLVAHLPVVAANFVSTSCGMATSFVLNRGFTFQSEGSVKRQLALFVLVTGTGLWVLQPFVISAASGLGVFGAKLAGMAVGLVWNFSLYRWVVFRVASSPACAPMSSSPTMTTRTPS
jgi:putative flippase GtrA